MKLVIDACVLVPVLTRALVLRAIAVDNILPIWSAQILGEWKHTIDRLGDAESAAVSTEILLMNSRYPSALVEVPEGELDHYHLPDPQDRHVLGAGVIAQADTILTFNTRDFPIRTLAEFGLLRRHPDEFLLETAQSQTDVFEEILDDASRLSGRSRRALLRSSHLPRLSKFLTA